MLHERLYQRLVQQRATLSSGKYIEKLAEDMQHFLLEGAPVMTGTLARNLSSSTGIKETNKGFRVGFGPRSKVGVSDRGAPRGTIAAFLRDHPEFRRNMAFVRSVGAWQALPKEGKELLQQEREQGSYGGANQGVGVGKSAYLYPQEGTFPSWNASAGKARISPTGFIAWSVDEWRARSLPMAMLIFRKDMGVR